MSEIKDGWLADSSALVGKHEPANDHADSDFTGNDMASADGGASQDCGGDFMRSDLAPIERRRARGPVRAGPRLYEAPTTEVISRKEHARLLRRQAYQRAKQLRATDPRHLALKEALKQRRRAAYQVVKAKRKAAAAEQKSAAKAERANARESSSESLMQHVRRGADALTLLPRRRPPSDE